MISALVLPADFFWPDAAASLVVILPYEWTIWMPVTVHPNMSNAERTEYKKAYPNEDESTAPLVDTLLRLPLLKITAHKADQNGAKVYSYIFTKQVNAQTD